MLRTDLVDGIIDILITGSQPHPEMVGRYLKDIAKEWGTTEQEACDRLINEANASGGPDNITIVLVQMPD